MTLNITAQTMRHDRAGIGGGGGDGRALGSSCFDKQKQLAISCIDLTNCDLLLL